MVTTIHTHVEGRGRYKVDGLFQSEECKTFLELRLSRYNGIEKVSASRLTGNILVCFNPENTHTGIQELIREALKEAKDICLPDKHLPKQDGGITPDEKASFRQLIKNLFFSPEEINNPWHLMDTSSVLAQLETNPETGLFPDQVIERLKRYGPNTLPVSQPRSGLEILWDQLNSLPVYLLAAAAGVSILTGGFIDAVVIAGIVSVPADCRIIAADYLTIDESILTGESLPVNKKRLP